MTHDLAIYTDKYLNSLLCGVQEELNFRAEEKDLNFIKSLNIKGVTVNQLMVEICTDCGKKFFYRFHLKSGEKFLDLFDEQTILEDNEADQFIPMIFSKQNVNIYRSIYDAEKVVTRLKKAGFLVHDAELQNELDKYPGRQAELLAKLL